MALRGQPYFPFYVDDFMSDEKLSLCGAESTGVYIRLMCLMHKSEEYGVILLKSKFKSKTKATYNFSLQLSRQMPFTAEVVEAALDELIEENVVTLNGDRLYQKRMVKDANLSLMRAEAGAKGGKNVKNSPTRRLYNESGYLYLFEDIDNENIFKIGISKNPDKRLLAIQNKTGKSMKCVHIEECDNMGLLEDNILNALRDNRDGEWIFGLELSSIVYEIQKQNGSNSLANQNQNSVIGTGTVIDNVTTIDSVPKVPKEAAEPKPYEEIIGYLNQIAGTHFQFDTPTTQKLIDARLKKYTVEDFRTVIDKKCKEWLNTEMEKNIKPSTLFALSHFDDYLNQLVGTGKPTYNKPVDTRNDINKDYSEGEDFIQFCARRHKEEDEQKAKEPK